MQQFKKRKLYVGLTLVVLIVAAITFAITYGQNNGPTLNYDNNKLSGIIDNVVHVNDLDADYYFYRGKNYTDSSNGVLPDGSYQGIYPEGKFVEVELTYSSTDINSGYKGWVSLGERQDTYIYYKVFPVNTNGTSDTSDDYIMIELIENPFTDRPTDMGFNGWVSSYPGVSLTFDSNYYMRYAKVPVSYSNNLPSKVNITFNASWVPVKSSFLSGSSWSSAFSGLDNKEMQSIHVADEGLLPLDMTGYFRRVTVSYGQSYVGLYDINGVKKVAPSDPSFCIAWNVPVGAEAYDENGILQVSEGANSDICYKEGMIVFKQATSFSNISTSGGEFDFLLVAGGGSGGRSAGGSAGAGGGGAGGLILRQGYYLNSGNYSITVGAGGIASSSSGDYNGMSGENTSAFGFTAIGGGGGGARSSSGLSGGSGGGGGSRGGTGGSGTYGQGNAGGDGDAAINADNGAGGGGGYSSQGGIGISNNKGGDGGTGYNGSSIFGTLVGANGWFSGGGGGGISGSNTAGLGGTGGGGLGGVGTAAGQDGLDNTGGGGGGSPRSSYGAGDGGSGVVIVRWDQSMQSATCQNVSGCTYYEMIDGEYFNDSNTYYELVGGTIQYIDNGSLPFEYGNVYQPGFDDNSVMAGYYRSVNIPRYSSQEGYYNINGVIQTGNCNTYGGCNLYELIQYYDGTTPNSPSYSENYYYLATRDTNIVVMTSNTSSTWSSSQNKPFTLTSVYNGVDYRSSALWNTARAVNAYNDTNIENIRMSSGQTRNTSTPTSSTNTSRVFYGRWQNVRFGRGIIQYGSYTSFATVMGGSNGSTGSSSNVTKYRLIIESGIYSTFAIANGASYTYTDYIQAKTIYGNDYDRVSNNNSNLDLYYCASGSWGGNVYSGSEDASIFDLTVKSGSYGSSEYDYTTGIYVGGRQGGTHYNSRMAKIEGGDIYNLIGGPLSASSRENINDSFIYMTGGEVDIIIGGAGTSATYGNRIIQVTGGRVNYSVFGGSNGYQGSSTDGTVRGSSLLYIGGKAIIGNPSLVSSSATIFGAEAGSVFGIGNGRSGYPSIGSSSNSNIIIGEDAVINNNVYGGGNFSTTGISSGSSTTSTKIMLNGGTIKGDLYGGGNNNGSGNSSVYSTITITSYDGTVEGSLYGGSNVLGTIYGDVNLNLYGGTFKSAVYGGGKGGYLNSSNPGTFVRNDINMVLGNETLSPTFERNVYGGSAFGTVNAITTNPSASNDTVTININNATVLGNLFGGARGDATYEPYVAGNITVNLNGGNVANLFGGNDQNGDIVRNSTIYLSGGTVGTVYGAGNQVDGNITNIYLQGSIATTIYGGSNLSGNVTKSNITATTGTVGTIYGGNNQGGKTTESAITINGGLITTVYGGGRLADTDKTTLNLNGTTITNVYGGGADANVTINTNINLNGSTVTNLFGGSNLSGDVPTANINVLSGNVTNLYGANNQGGLTSTPIILVSGGSVTNLYGGGKLADTTKSNVTINGGNHGYIYGGGENASITTDSNIVVSSGSITSVFGGSNLSGNVPSSNVDINGGTITNVYGGNNLGGSTVTSHVDINGGTITNAYGGGKEASTVTSNINVYKTTGLITNLYGGGNFADVASSNVLIRGGLITNVYGGSNQSGTVDSSYINVDKTSQQSNVTMNVTYNALDTESWQSTTYPTIVNATITITNTTGSAITDWDGSLFLLNSTIFSNYSSTNVTENAGLYTFNEVNKYYGINSIPAGGSYSFDISFLTMQDKNDVNFNYSFVGGGYNYSNSSVPIISNLYGGNNQGGLTNNVSLDLNEAVITNVYGGGNQATVSGDTLVDVDNTTILGYLFGGGNDGGVSGSANVYVTNANVSKSVYAGGNGATAGVLGDTILYIDGSTYISEHVFGGGNAATTGDESNNNSIGEVNISGGTILGNVYGGANTSVLYGTAEVNIGYNLGYSLVEDTILINGTVFGGGEANASGSENYDYSFISVTNGITININGSPSKSLTINGSIFGSGNASSTTGYSLINISNYGTSSSHKRNISIQRANLVVLNNSYLELYGATDRTNEYSSTLFTLSRIKELKLVNSSSIYLETGSNLLEKLSSVYNSGSGDVKGYATITDTGITRNVDNRVYMKEGKNLNIATNESVTAYGEVSGMFFFGMYIRDRDGNPDEAAYSPTYNFGDTVLVGDFYKFSSGSYVLGWHATNHNIEVDGFYSNYENEDLANTVQMKYINPTPEDSNYYMWVIGETVASYDISIAASKYSTLGTYELPLLNFYQPNTSFSILGFNYNDLPSDFELVKQSDIPRIATDGKADTRMSLVMKTSNTGWITVGETNFLTDEESPIYGTIDYYSENSTVVPSLLFYIYHSKNLSTAGNIGIVTISLLAVTPIDDLTNKVERININVDLSRILYATNEYEAAMTPGEEHDMFVTTLTDVTNKSKFTSYFSLLAESANPFYKTGDYHAFVSSYVFPENTKFTMIDLTTPTPEYYYYVVSAADVTAANSEYQIHGEASYKLSKFIKMGSSSNGNNYNDEVKNATYYDSNTHLAHEEFVVIVDLSLTNITSSQLSKTFLIELRNSGDQTLVSVLGIQHSSMTYNIHYDKDAVIELDSSLSKSSIYTGDTFNLNINTNFVQQTYQSRVIQDTTYYYKKLGFKISIYDENDNVLNGVSLMGVTFKYNNVTYYPQMDGIIRINVAPRVANVSSKIEVSTKNSNLSSGNYKVKVESFGSPDGIYFGLISSDEQILNLSVLNKIYGLDVTLPAGSVIIDKDTGFSSLGSNTLVFNIRYSSGLTSPNIRMSLQRRMYDEIYSSNYEVVDLMDYISTSLTSIGDPTKKEYLITNTPIANENKFIVLKNNLMSGTYRAVFSIYDGNNYIGEVYTYVIIK